MKRLLENNSDPNQDTNLLHVESPPVNVEQQLPEPDRVLLQNFHAEINKLVNKLCSICKEYFLLVELIEQRCRCCYYDKGVIKKFSKENNMDPGDVPEKLKGLTEIEEMLILKDVEGEYFDNNNDDAEETITSNFVPAPLPSPNEEHAIADILTP
ncbi:19043_t:CDS:2 [Racocetra fulgida]|uniref:19043_t:CDS:1 n=1 Tax=Racocetra fulgida TaxID=60492 RepID=A0A9N9G8A6_9GLOM|nr:19043_t:CDS:2 [Racocetra fulgida]